MLKSLAMTVLNRLIVLAAILLAADAYARSSCSPGNSPFAQIEKAVTGLSDVAAALQRR